MLDIVFGLGLICGLIVISANNPIYSVFRLIGLFINAAVLLLTLEVDFLAFILLIVYVGAIAVLFLFVIMMLHLNLMLLKDNLIRYLPIGTLMAFLILINVFLLSPENIVLPVSQMSQIEIFGEILYSNYGIYFIIASLILFVAMIGAILIVN